MTTGAAIDFSPRYFSAAKIKAGMGIGFGGGFNYSPSIFTMGMGSANLSGAGDTNSIFFNTQAIRQQNSYNQTRIAMNVANVSRDSSLDRKIKNLISYIEKGQEDKALSEYYKLLTEMKSQERYSECYDDNNDENLRAVTQKIIESTGINLEQLIRDNTRDNVEVEWQIVRSGNNCDTTTKEDLLKELCGIDEDKGHSTMFGRFFQYCAKPFVWTWNWTTNGGKKM